MVSMVSSSSSSDGGLFLDRFQRCAGLGTIAECEGEETENFSSEGSLSEGGLFETCGAARSGEHKDLSGLTTDAESDTDSGDSSEAGRPRQRRRLPLGRRHLPVAEQQEQEQGPRARGLWRALAGQPADEPLGPNGGLQGAHDAARTPGPDAQRAGRRRTVPREQSPHPLDTGRGGRGSRGQEEEEVRQDESGLVPPNHVRLQGSIEAPPRGPAGP